MPNCINVFVTADLPDRIARLKENHPEWDEKQIESIIESTDEKRADYYNYYSCKTWGMADTYHLCINTSVLGVEETALFIKEFVEKKMGK